MSVLRQTILPARVVIVDDGSTDRSLRRVEEIVKTGVSLGVDCDVVSKSNGGASSARNVGVARLNTKYVAFLDADDEWDEHFLEKMCSLIQDFPNSVLYCLGHRVIVDDSESIDRDSGKMATRGKVENFFKSSISSSVANSSKVCVCKAALHKIGGFPEGVLLGEDLYVWIRLAMEGDVVSDSYVGAMVYRQASHRIRIKSRNLYSPFPLEYFRKRRSEIANYKWLATYLKIVGLKHFLPSVLEGDFRSATRRWAALWNIFPLFAVALLPSFLFIPIGYAFDKSRRISRQE
tara:strand:- start:6818 stop:7690 length:873 start_codon:yes stop_codon:yes gene_type:complete